MFADLTSVAGSLYKFGAGRGLPGEVTPRRIAIHADEFNELIGDEFIPLLNKAGGAGFQVTAYTQTWSDVEARIGSPAKAGQIAGNFNTLIMLRVKEVARVCTACSACVMSSRKTGTASCTPLMPTRSRLCRSRSRRACSRSSCAERRLMPALLGRFPDRHGRETSMASAIVVGSR